MKDIRNYNREHEIVCISRIIFTTHSPPKEGAPSRHGEHGEERFYGKSATGLESLWLGEEVPIFHKFQGLWPLNALNGAEELLFVGTSRQIKILLLCDLRASVVKVNNFMLYFIITNNDELVKSRKSLMIVIPANAGIQ